MQRVCASGGVERYLSDPDSLRTPEALACPFCADGHRLWLHGWYERYVILPGGAGWRRIPVRRLCCSRSGRTVSLLPDFCVPRRQHGAAVLGAFLEEHLVAGKPLVAALAQARGSAGPHSVAQALRDGFARQAGRLTDYLPMPSRRMAGTPLRTLVLALRQGFADAAGAFLHHGRSFHARYGLGLA